MLAELKRSPDLFNRNRGGLTSKGRKKRKREVKDREGNGNGREGKGK